MSIPRDGSAPTVLLVDDFDDARQMYGHYLRHFGYEPIEAATGEDALTLAFAHTPAVILMDLQLPGIDGWEVTRRLKKDERTKHIPIIALTAHALDRERERTRQAGAMKELRARLTQQQGDLARWNADPDTVKQSVMKLVLTLVDFLRQVMERQALRRMESGTLSDEEIEKLGLALMRLEETVHDLARQAGLDPKDLNLDLGPLGKLT